MKKNKCCDLQSCFMCKLVLNDWKQSIGNNRKNFLVKKGEVLINEGDPVNGIYFVYSGKVKVHKKWGEKEIIVRFANNGAIIGHRGLGTKNNAFPISATALEPTLVCFIELDFFMSTLKVNTELTFQLMMFFAEELHESEKKMRNLVHMTVKARLALAIIKLEDQFGTTPDGFINIQLSRQDIASFAGTTYESVFRMMTDLVKEGLITISGKDITIKNHPGLTALTEQAE